MTFRIPADGMGGRDSIGYREVPGFGCLALLTRYGGNIATVELVPLSDHGAPLWNDRHMLTDPTPGFLVALAHAFGLPPIPEASQ